MQLTPEQLEKAAQITYETWYRCGTKPWKDATKQHKQDMRDAVTAAFAAVEPRQVNAPADLVERMLAVFFERHWPLYRKETTPEASRKMLGDMTAALRVALEDPRVLGEPDDSETDDIVRVKLGFGPSGKVSPDFRYGAKLVLASRRARLLQTVRVQDRVEAFPTGHTWCVVVDKDRNHKDTRYNLPDEDLAQGYRLGLISKLKGESQ